MENTLFDQISLCTIFIYIQNLYSGNKISIIYENNILSVVHYHEIIVIEVKTHYYKYVQNIEKPNSLEQEKHRA